MPDLTTALPQHEALALLRGAGVDTPYYAARRRADGAVEIVTRDGALLFASSAAPAAPLPYPRRDGALQKGARPDGGYPHSDGDGDYPCSGRDYPHSDGDEDFTRIPGVGPRISAALVAAGFHTFAALAAAPDAALLATPGLNRAALTKLRAFLDFHGYRA